MVCFILNEMNFILMMINFMQIAWCKFLIKENENQQTKKHSQN